MYICEYFVFCSTLVKYDFVVVGLLMNSWSIDVVLVVMRCCCRWFMLWVFIIMELWWDLSGFWKFYEKWVNWWFVMKWYFDSSIIWFCVPFYDHKRLDKPWGRIWALGNQNWGFGVKMEVFLESWVAEFCHNSPWRAHGELEASFVCVNSPWRVKCLPWRVA